MIELSNDCYKMYVNDIKILEDNPEKIINQTNPQKVLENMKEKSLSQVFVFVPFNHHYLFFSSSK